MRRLLPYLVALIVVGLVAYYVLQPRTVVEEETAEPTVVTPRPPLFRTPTITEGDTTGQVERRRIADARDVSTVVRVEPDTIPTTLTVEPPAARWFPDLSLKRPQPRIRVVGEGARVTLTPQGEPIFDIQFRPAAGLAYDGVLRPAVSLYVARAWMVHGGITLTTDGVGPSASVRLRENIMVGAHYHGGIGASLQITF